MAYVREPGSLVERTAPRDAALPEDERAIFVFRVLTHAQWLRFESITRALKPEDTAGILDSSKRLLAMALVEVRQLWVVDEDQGTKPFKLQTKAGRLSDRSASVLHEYLHELVNMISENHTFRSKDAKNLRSPSPLNSVGGAVKSAS